MKKVLIIYNIIFLFTGNVLLSSVHHLFIHDHSHDITLEKHECIECINAENSNNYILDTNEVNFLNNNINEFILLYRNDIKFTIDKSSDSRAPPISL
tara:strand:- start:230 stop:520 length:291 start_codon:yes stop_codon:yes gene_type:complete